MHFYLDNKFQAPSWSFKADNANENTQSRTLKPQNLNENAHINSAHLQGGNLNKSKNKFYPFSFEIWLKFHITTLQFKFFLINFLYLLF